MEIHQIIDSLTHTASPVYHHIFDFITNTTSSLYHHIHHFLTHTASQTVSNIRNQNHYATLLAILLSTPFFLYSYDRVATLTAEDAIREDLNLSRDQSHFIITYMSRTPLIGGALFAGVISNYIGRKLTVGMGAGAYTVGALVVSLTTNYVCAMFGRVLTGAGIGMGLVIGPIFIAEIAPAPRRGFLCSFPQVLMAGGMVVVSAMKVGHPSWRLMTGLAAIPSALLSLVLLLPNVIPDTPCWLVALGNLDDAVNLLKRCGASDEEVSGRMIIIKEDIGIPNNSTGNGVRYETTRRGVRRFWHYGGSFKWIQPRWFAIAGLFVSQEMASPDSALGFLRTILAHNKHPSDNLYWITNIFFSITQLICTMVPTLLLDSLGRRRMLLVSIGGMGMLWAGISATFIVNAHQPTGWSPILAVYAVQAVGMIGFNSFGLGIIPWIFGPEVLPLPVRAPLIGLAVGVKFGVGLCLGLASPFYHTTYENAGFSFLFYCIVMVISFVICYLCFRVRTCKLLETKD